MVAFGADSRSVGFSRAIRTVSCRISRPTLRSAQWEAIAAVDFFTTEVWTIQGLVTSYTLFVIELRLAEGPWSREQRADPWGRSICDDRFGRLSHRRLASC